MAHVDMKLQLLMLICPKLQRIMELLDSLSVFCQVRTVGLICKVGLRRTWFNTLVVKLFLYTWWKHMG